MDNLYKIQYGDFGEVYVIADSFREAEEKFSKENPETDLKAIGLVSKDVII